MTWASNSETLNRVTWSMAGTARVRELRGNGASHLLLTIISWSPQTLFHPSEYNFSTFSFLCMCVFTCNCTSAINAKICIARAPRPHPYLPVARWQSRGGHLVVTSMAPYLCSRAQRILFVCLELLLSPSQSKQDRNELLSLLEGCHNYHQWVFLDPVSPF